MHYHRLFALLISSLVCNYAIGQTKKEQIITLNQRVDSLNVQIAIQASDYAAQLDKLERNKNDLLDKLDVSNKQLAERDSALSRWEVEIANRDIQISDLKTKMAKSEKELASLKQELQRTGLSFAECQEKQEILNDSIVLLNSFLNRYNTSEPPAREYNGLNKDLSNIDCVRKIMINGKPLVLEPFEMFDVMTFEHVAAGLIESLIMEIPDRGVGIGFHKYTNEIIYEGEYDSEFIGTGNKVIIKLPYVGGEILRSIVKGKKYKVIYTYQSDIVTHRALCYCEPTDGYSIIDIVELTQPFKRELEETPFDD